MTTDVTAHAERHVPAPRRRRWTRVAIVFIATFGTGMIIAMGFAFWRAASVPRALFLEQLLSTGVISLAIAVGAYRERQDRKVTPTRDPQGSSPS